MRFLLTKSGPACTDFLRNKDRDDLGNQSMENTAVGYLRTSSAANVGEGKTRSCASARQSRITPERPEW